MGKKLKTKIIALFLAAFLTIPVLSGCDKKGDNLPSGGNNSEITDGENGNQGNGSQDNQGDNSQGEEAEIFTVTFVSNGGAEIAPQQIKQGEKAVKPLDPEKTNYVFVGWYNGETEWNFETMKVNGSVTLSAKWRDEFTPPYLPRS